MITLNNLQSRNANHINNAKTAMKARKLGTTTTDNDPVDWRVERGSANLSTGFGGPVANRRKTRNTAHLIAAPLI